MFRIMGDYQGFSPPRHTMAGGSSVGGRSPGHFLNGEVKWWVPPAGKPFSKERREEDPNDYLGRKKRILDAIAAREMAVPDGCQHWRRQRLRPLAISMLLPTSYSLFFVALGGMLTIFSFIGTTPPQYGVYSCYFAAALLSIVWLLVLNKRMEGVHPNAFTLPFAILLVASMCTSVIIALASTEANLLFIAPTASAILLFTYYLLFVIVLEGGPIQGARWLLPIEGSKNKLLWKNEVIRRTSLSRGPVVTVEGVLFHGQKFISLSYQPRSFLPRKDPFYIDTSENVKSHITAIMHSYLPICCEWPKWAEPIISTEEE